MNTVTHAEAKRGRRVGSAILFAKPMLASVLLSALPRVTASTSVGYLRCLRFALDIQLNPEELSAVLKELEDRRPCNFLVFGVGYDSILWDRFNRGGRTVFLEHNESWERRVGTRYRMLEVRKVAYQTRRTQSDELLEATDRLEMDLPRGVTNRKWSVVLVDGPPGHTDDNPGRMQSIFTASKLVEDGGAVFVHDVNRPVEDIYSRRYLGEGNIVRTVGRLRQHRIQGPS